MAIIKKDGFVVGAVKANEIDVKRLEENGFVVIIKQLPQTNRKNNKKNFKKGG